MFSRMCSLVLLLIALPLVTFAQGIDDYITTLATFLNNIVVPVLFSIAFLMFLINITRYFILEGASEEGREKAKRNALWGILAFVLLISLWTLTTLLLDGLRLSRDDAICPDYLTSFGFRGGCSTDTGARISGGKFSEPTFPAPAPNRPAPPLPGDGRDSGASRTGGTADGSNNDAQSSNGSDNDQLATAENNPPLVANLAELIFGDARDGAALVDNEGVAAAQDSTLTILQPTRCIDGVLQLQNYAKNADNQAAYIYYKNSDETNWVEVTDSTGLNRIGIDRSLVTSIGNDSSNENIHLFHIHPAEQTDELTLNMNGQGPSRADFNLMCNLGINRITYHVVDSHGIWSYQAKADTCPYNNDAQTDLGKIETYLALSVLRSGQRSVELEKYVDSLMTGSAYDSEFKPLIDSINSYQPEAIRNLIRPEQTATKTYISYEDSINDFCDSL